jgi:outer membrane protein OmpA-like peptidoglycan-associated protein
MDRPTRGSAVGPALVVLAALGLCPAVFGQVVEGSAAPPLDPDLGLRPAVAPAGGDQPPPALRLAPPSLALAPPPPEAGEDRLWLRIVFPAEEKDLPAGHDVLLQLLIDGLDDPAGQRLRIRAYAGGADGAAARRLSLERALAIRSRLLAMGVDDRWIEVRALGGLGDTRPADRADIVMVGP